MFRTRWSKVPTATQFGGYPLWAAFADPFGIDVKLARNVKMNRGEGFTAPPDSMLWCS